MADYTQLCKFPTGILRHITDGDKGSSMSKKIAVATIDELLAAFGGPSKLAKLLHVSQSAISLWKIRETVPPGWHVRLLIEADRRNITLSPTLFKIEGEDAKVFSRLFRRGAGLGAQRRPRLSASAA